jgi:FKBP-type peptidyl-prolyl cis-trans isomerase FklB
MLKYFFFPLALAMVSLNTLQAQNPPKMDSVSYSFGILIAQNLKNQGIESLDVKSLAAGLQDGLSKTDIDPAKANQIVQKHMQALESKKYQGNLEEGKKFLEENSKRPGVVTLPSGLQYEILTPGNGPIPKSNDKVRVHYTGSLINGKVFDSSVQRGEPAVFGVTQVIKGWVEALQLMPVGAKWKLAIPYDLAYGERGAGREIGPYATLIFEVELLAIEY